MWPIPEGVGLAWASYTTSSALKFSVYVTKQMQLLSNSFCAQQTSSWLYFIYLFYFFHSTPPQQRKQTVALLNKALGSKAYFGTKLYFLNGEILLDSLFYYTSSYRAPPAPNDQNKLWSLGLNAMSSNFHKLTDKKHETKFTSSNRVPIGTVLNMDLVTEIYPCMGVGKNKSNFEKPKSSYDCRWLWFCNFEIFSSVVGISWYGSIVTTDTRLGTHQPFLTMILANLR